MSHPITRALSFPFSSTFANFLISMICSWLLCRNGWSFACLNLLFRPCVLLEIPASHPHPVGTPAALDFRALWPGQWSPTLARPASPPHFWEVILCQYLAFSFLCPSTSTTICLPGSFALGQSHLPECSTEHIFGHRKCFFFFPWLLYLAIGSKSCSTNPLGFHPLVTLPVVWQRKLQPWELIRRKMACK